jgi:nucleoid DNA-binding protein
VGPAVIKSELVQRISAQNPHLYERDVDKIVNAVLGEMRRYGHRKVAALLR